MKLSAIINGTSGSVPNQAGELLTAAVDEIGHHVDIFSLDDGELPDAVDRAFSSDPDAVIVWGGDGTVACAMQKAGQDGPAILPLPGGTMNMLHKQVHGEYSDWRDCLSRALQSDHRIRIPAGRAGDHMFYVAVMIGSLTSLAEPREALRKGRFVTMAESLSGADIMNFRAELSMASDGGEPRQAADLAIFVGEPGSDAFDVGDIAPNGPVDLIAAGVSALLSGWKNSDAIHSFRAREVVVENVRGHDLQLTLDGEPMTLPSGSRFERVDFANWALSARPV